MPLKKKDRIELPEWVARLEDECLSEAVSEALLTRAQAERRGAANYPNCRRVLKAGDQTIEAIKMGRVTGQRACRKAAVAERKYTTAVECAKPTARRFSSTQKG